MVAAAAAPACSSRSSSATRARSAANSAAAALPIPPAAPVIIATLPRNRSLTGLLPTAEGATQAAAVLVVALVEAPPRGLRADKVRAGQDEGRLAQLRQAVG